MTQRSLLALVVALALAWLSASQVLAAARTVARSKPDLTQGGVRDDSQDCTLGPTGARG